MAFILPELPYAPAAFGDRLSAETFEYHHGKHHRAYVTKANELVEKDSALAGKSLLELIEVSKDGANTPLFNQVGQIWNHSFYWQSLSPEPTSPSADLKERIDADFGGQEALAAKFKEEAIGHFASGWAALVVDGDTLKVTSYHDADTPVAHGHTPLLIVDVWEHAYYIDYHNARPDYAAAIIEESLNWEFASQNLDGKGASRADQPG
jgi:superoxide dismutase, Fe-Mn family